MEKLTNGLRIFLRLIWKLLCAMVIIFVVFMTIIFFLQIATRTMGVRSFKWSEEVLRYAYIWVVFMGVSVAIYSNELPRFDLLRDKLSPLANKILETILIIVMLTILTFMLLGSFMMIRIQMRQVMTSINIRMGYVYMVLPIFAVTSMLFLLTKIFLLWTDRPDLHKVTDEKKSTEGAGR